MQPRPKQIHSGNFFQSKSKFNLIKAGGIFVILAAVIVTAFVLHKKDNKLVSSAVTNSAVGTETPDWWNLKYFGHSVCESELCKADKDLDNDGLSNYQEYYYHTDPLNPHTVNDSLNDGELVAQGFDPSKPGRVTFDAAASDDSILGESLLLDQDIKKIVDDSLDLSKVTVPTPKDSELKIISEDNADVAKKYLTDIGNATKEYFSDSDMQKVNNIIANQGQDASGGGDSELIKSKASALSSELKNIEVPMRFIDFHKDLIAFYDLLGQIAVGADASNTQAPDWYDKAQQFYLVQTRLSQDKNLLIQGFPK